MFIKYVVEKALLLNNAEEINKVVIKTDVTTIFTLHLLKMLVLLLCQFSLAFHIKEDSMYNFIMQNFKQILDIVTTEIEIALHNFVELYDEQLGNEIELHNKDETMLVLIIQDKVIKRLERIRD